MGRQQEDEVPLDAALTKAVEDIRETSPYVVAAKSGASYEQDRFLLPFFDRTFHIYFPEIRLEEPGAGPVPDWLQVLLLHYLVNAKGIPIADVWVAYRDLPGAYLFEGRFRQMAIQPLERAFGHDLQGFRRAGLALGGEPMSRTGDAAFKFMAFPRIPMACILYLGEEELPSAVNVLFDGAAYAYLPTEDLSGVSSYLAGAMLRRKG